MPSEDWLADEPRESVAAAAPETMTSGAQPSGATSASALARRIGLEEESMSGSVVGGTVSDIGEDAATAAQELGELERANQEIVASAGSNCLSSSDIVPSG